MNLRRVEPWLALALLAIAVVVFWPRAPQPGEEPAKPRARPAPALAGLPKGAAVVVTLDLQALRQSSLGALLGEDKKLFAVSRVREVCGFDPIEHAREAALALPEAAKGQDPDATADFGLVVAGDYDAQNIVDCAARMIAQGGGAPAKTRFGSFVSVRDRNRPEGEIAVRNGGPVLVGGGSYLREMLDAAEGTAPTLLGDDAHSTLRASVGTGGALLATWIARPGWIERYLDPEHAGASPLSAMRAGALRVDLTPTATATLLLACPSEDECKKLAAFVERFRDDSRKAANDAFGVDPVRTARVTREKNVVRMRVEFDGLSLMRVAARLLAPEQPSPPPSAEPDEIIRPPR
jgi:hypothetical protein